MSRRLWTGKEVAHLRACYGSRPPALIAADLGRSVASVVSRAHAFGLARRPDRAPLLRRLRDLRSRGLSDGQIARRLGLAKPTVRRWRRSLGLAPVKDGGRAARNARAREWEYEHWGAFLRGRRRLRYAGHPWCVTFGQLLVYGWLRSRGESTLGEMARALAFAAHRRTLRRAAAELAGLGVVASVGGVMWLPKRRAAG